MNQTDLPPALPAWAGSPASLVAAKLLESALPELPVSTSALAKLSLFVPLDGVNTVVLVAVPPGAATLIGPTVAPAGTAAVICVTEFTVKPALAPLNETLVTPLKLAPVMTTLAPTAALAGEMPEIAGTVAARRPVEHDWCRKRRGCRFVTRRRNHPPRCGRWRRPRRRMRPGCWSPPGQPDHRWPRPTSSCSTVLPV